MSVILFVLVKAHSSLIKLLGLIGEGMCQGGKPGTGKLYTYVALSTSVGAWSMALGLRQRFD